MLTVPIEDNHSLAVAGSKNALQPLSLNVKSPQRTSSLESPIMLLTGHQSAIYTMKFNPMGTIIASRSHDKDIFLWHIHGNCKNFAILYGHKNAILHGHKNAVLDLQWTTDGSQINLQALTVPSVPGMLKLVDKGTAKLWDLRLCGAVQTLPDKYQITAVGFSDAADKVYTGGLDNDVKVKDPRRNEVVMTLQGHGDMIIGMQLSPDASYLLNGMDCTFRIWDLRP